MTQMRPTEMMMTKREAFSTRGMVATKDRLATRAGVRMLEAGGNAVDAAVAACFAIGVVEPASSGIGGGGYLVYQVGDAGGVVGFPMRGPLSVTAGMYELSGEPSAGSFFWAGVVGRENIEGYRSIATPGAVAGLCRAIELHGRLPLADVMAPAISLARDGFSPSWYALYSSGLLAGTLFKYPELRRVFMPGDEMPTGDLVSPPRLRQPDLADALEAIARGGPDAFYKGDIAARIVSDIQANDGVLSRDDLAGYRPFHWKNGLELRYRDRTVRVPPFACAGTTSAMTLKMLDGFDVRAMGHNSVEMLHAYISCARLAYADRFQYMADPGHVDVPWEGLVSDSYTTRRRASITDRAPAEYAPGDPWVEEGRGPREALPASLPAFDTGTTHLCAMDADGNAVSLTNTVGGGFGSGIVPKGTGVVMNNGMLWWDPIPGRINSIMPGKLPLNNMSPALVLDSDGVRLSVGASGGRRITNCVTQLIVKTVDFGMGPQDAIDSSRIDCSTPFTSVDLGLDEQVHAGLESRGHRLTVLGEEFVQSGFGKFASPVAILRDGPGSFRGGADTFHSAYCEGPE